MLTDPVSISSLSLVFVLGLRHGFDPDHIAIIDCMAYRSIQDRPAFASWIGTLFALGHGLTVTAIAVVLCAFTREVSLPESLSLMLSWVPVGLLILIGTLNLRDLLRADHYQPKGWKTHFIPKRLRDSSHPLAIFFIGVMFALVFDTATQAAAWGYAATTQGGVAMALIYTWHVNHRHDGWSFNGSTVTALETPKRSIRVPAKNWLVNRSSVLWDCFVQHIEAFQASTRNK
jgi:nickel/cobalt transporter (NiCoT) family protein